MKKSLTIIVPNYRTPELTKLCMRLLRKNTDFARTHVIAIDNDSRDASTEYLRKLNWIEFMERPAVPGEKPLEMHALALDMALERVTTPLVLIIHTDTLLLEPGWLDFLLGELGDDPQCAGVGSWKLEIPSWHKRLLKWLESFFLRKKEFRYLRSHCALYRTELLRLHTGGFFDGESAGRALHRKLEKAGFHFKFIEPRPLLRYMRHLDHATMILNPEIAGRKTGTPRARERVRRELNHLDFQRILDDDRLDS